MPGRPPQFFTMPRRLTLIGLGAALACAGRTDTAVPPPARESRPVRADTVRVTVPDPELQERVTQLELRLLEREAQIEALQTELDEARREAVRAMAQLQSTATRAEAASAMAEAEVAVQALRGRGGQAGVLAQARRLLDESTAEFNRQNFSGAVYLANQVKEIAAAGQGRGGNGEQRAGEQAFAAPVRLQTTGRVNVRDGPGTAFRVLFTLERGTAVQGQSYVADWIRVTLTDGRSGWIAARLVGRREGGS
jgi:hypothetical protein